MNDLQLLFELSYWPHCKQHGGSFSTGQILFAQVAVSAIAGMRRGHVLVCTVVIVQVAVITAAKELLDALVRMLKGVMRLTVQQPADLGGNCEAWESVLFHCKNLFAPVVDLGAGEAPLFATGAWGPHAHVRACLYMCIGNGRLVCVGLYSPQEQEELESAADAIATGAEVLAGDVPAPDNPSSKFQADAAKLEVAHARLLECVKKV